MTRKLECFRVFLCFYTRVYDSLYFYTKSYDCLQIYTKVYGRMFWYAVVCFGIKSYNFIYHSRR